MCNNAAVLGVPRGPGPVQHCLRQCDPSSLHLPFCANRLSWIIISQVRWMQLNLVEMWGAGVAGGRSNRPVTWPRPRPQQGFFFPSSRGTQCPRWVVHCLLPPAAKGSCLICKVLYLSAGIRMNGRTPCFAAEYCAGASEVMLSLSAALVGLMLLLIGGVCVSVCVWVNSETHTHTHAKTITLSPNANVFPVN